MPATLPQPGGPPHFPCKEHSDIKSADQRRRHVNLIMLDGCEEFERTYRDDGWPKQPLEDPIASPQWGMPRSSLSLSTTSRDGSPTVMTATQHISATGASPPVTTAGSKELAERAASPELGQAAATTTGKKWVCAYEQGGQEAANLARQVGSQRTPAGTFFNITRPGHLRSQSADGTAPLPTDEARPSADASGYVGDEAASPELRASRPWLMPHQTGDRAAGAATAKAINSARTPIGSFAVFDLAKAPK